MNIVLLDTIRYLSFHDNKYIRYFRGHKGRVTSLEMSPLDDQFLSGAHDDSVRLWDLRTPTCAGVLSIQGLGRPCVAFDQGGIIFAVGTQKAIRLYDIKNFEKGPFTTFRLPEADAEWTSIKFSNDGNNILVSTRGDSLYIVDAFEGQIKRRLQGHMNNVGLELEGAFTPDSQFVLCGSQDGRIHYWEVETGRLVSTLEAHREPTNIVAFNPKYMMFASGDTNL
ncbi:hypothetical protein HK102_007308, partial [Quaeritorhiza haematococci]